MTVYIVALAVIALTVYIGLMCERNMWGYIVLYWAVLTLKNITEVLS